VAALSIEALQKFKKVRPLTLGQASRISGVNPSDVQILMVYMGQFLPPFIENFLFFVFSQQVFSSFKTLLFRSIIKQLNSVAYEADLIFSSDCFVLCS
jgi:hypothetical protein